MKQLATTVAVGLALAGCGSSGGRLGTFIAYPGDVGTWTVWRDGGTDVTYLTKRIGYGVGGRLYSPCAIDDWVLRVGRRSFSVTSEVFPLQVFRFPSVAKMWRSLARDSADYAFTRAEVERALKRGARADKPRWVKTFEDGCLHKH